MRRGDDHAFEALYRRYSTAVSRFVGARVRDSGRAEDLVQEIFAELSQNHHRVLVMREFEGLSYREIAQKMDMTRPAVESALFRARRRLQQEYARAAAVA